MIFALVIFEHLRYKERGHRLCSKHAKVIEICQQVRSSREDAGMGGAEEAEGEGWGAEGEGLGEVGMVVVVCAGGGGMVGWWGDCGKGGAG